MVNVLVIGSGGREHAIGWKLGQNNKIDTIFHAPGNGGTKNNLPINIDDLEGLAKFASENDCFTVVGLRHHLQWELLICLSKKV